MTMSLNEFILAFMGIVIGLGVGDLLTSFHKLLRAGSRVKWDWLTLSYAALMLYALIVFWWWQFGYPPAGETIRIADFLVNFVFLAIAFLMVAAALPDDIPEAGIDLRDFYLASLRHRWILVCIGVVLTVIQDTVYLINARAWGDLLWEIVPATSAILAGLATRIRAVWFQALAIAWIFGVTSYFNLFKAIGP